MGFEKAQKTTEGNEKINENKSVEELLLEKEKKEKKEEAVKLIDQLNNNIPSKYEIKLSIKDSGSRTEYYIVGGKNDILLNMPLNNESLKTYCEYINTLLNYNSDIQLLGGREWRAVAEIQFLGGTANAKRLIYKGLKHGGNESYYQYENNKIEELFSFIQKIKGVPREDWVIDRFINAQGKIGY
ncbi:hypothetical protein CSB08_01190 [Candidatus Gracilibacteria bacterium]|nr:MAG: hypothetical protein CSB08_01190 [Candidatus Gracilibacteria bacterium]PIE85585.1 MAG: hypothetical protein CSA08_01265 [Candidatus Gracilibacteria bacterium]